jgi:hypothetical protein
MKGDKRTHKGHGLISCVYLKRNGVHLIQDKLNSGRRNLIKFLIRRPNLFSLLISSLGTYVRMVTEHICDILKISDMVPISALLDRVELPSFISKQWEIIEETNV